MYYDRNGREIDFFEYGALHKNRKYKRVAYDVIPETHITVSTVWLGIDHAFGGGPPLIFETMVFADPELSMMEEYCNRYSTEQEAIDGHANTVQMVLVTLGVPQPSIDSIMKKRE